MADADTGAKPVDQDTLVADIDRTRTDLARTIDAISDRVSQKKNIDRAMDQARRRADQAMKEVRQGADRAMKEIRQGADRAMKEVRQGADRAIEQVRQIDPVIAGTAAAAATVVVVTTLILWRHRKR
jgi:cell division septum initiation protein DivIVA